MYVISPTSEWPHVTRVSIWTDSRGHKKTPFTHVKMNIMLHDCPLTLSQRQLLRQSLNFGSICAYVNSNGAKMVKFAFDT